MTSEQYEKGADIYRQISNLRISLREIMQDDKSVRIWLSDIEITSGWLNQSIRQDIDTYKSINEAAIRAELIDILKDNLVKLEDELKEI